MKSIFEEYGKVILVLIISTLLIVFIFSGMRLLDLLGVQADVDSEVSISNGEAAFATVAARDKPKISIVADKNNKTLYKNIAFQPVSMVECKDADGNSVEPVVTSIVLNSYKLDSDGNFVLDANGDRVSEKTEMIDYYNNEDDVIVLNPSHYSVSEPEHKKCLKSEFSGDNLEIKDEVNFNLTGSVIVTYKAIDGDEFKKTNIDTVVFIVDSQLWISQKEAFQPLRYIDADNRPYMDVSSIVFTYYKKNVSGEYELDSDGNRKTERIELFEYYNSSEDVITLNPSHYSESHESCTESEFSGDNLEINDSVNYNMTGSVVVTYKPTSNGEDKGLTSKTMMFIVGN